jgi:peptidyl-prolyl cis-trans isomerase A (cyclophilin A)
MRLPAALVFERDRKDRIGELKRLAHLALLIRIATAAPGELPPGLYAVFTTSQGVITAKLEEKYTPKTVENFVGLATGTKAWRDPKTGAMVKRPMYDNLTFHRIIRDEMIQTGDPTATSSHNCGFTIPDEFLIGLTFNSPGKLAMANSGQPDSGACQFFITAGAVARWNGAYTVFGEVVSGMPVVNAINHVPLRGDKPVDPPHLISVRIQRVGPEPKSKSKK